MIDRTVNIDRNIEYDFTYILYLKKSIQNDHENISFFQSGQHTQFDPSRNLIIMRHIVKTYS